MSKELEELWYLKQKYAIMQNEIFTSELMGNKNIGEAYIDNFLMWLTEEDRRPLIEW